MPAELPAHILHSRIRYDSLIFRFCQPKNNCKDCLKRYIPKNDNSKLGGLKLDLKTVKIEPPKDCNTILGMAHFIKTAEDLYEALVNSVPNIKFGLGFCESSGPCLVRHEGNDVELRRLVAKKAFEIGCGHSFLIFIKNAYPLNVP